ncbi:MAG TPA: hypothetical protein VMX57_07635, partial [Planctomycetota bacterium]|nr:hypothetical protein [Planctomycetota bacterium]
MSGSRLPAVVVLATTIALTSFAGARDLPEFARQFWPESGTPSTGEIRDGYIVWNGKPFFRNLHHGWSLWSAKRPDVFKTYRYYLLCNVASLGSESRLGAMALWRQDVDRGVRDAIVNHRFKEATRLYGMKVLVSHYLNGMQYQVPKELEGLDEEELLRRHNVLMKEAATRFASVWKHHPAVGGYEIAEEYWLPGYHAGDFWPPKSHYVAWLRKTYGTVEKMNAARGEKLERFEDVPYAKGRISGSGGANNLYLADFLLEDNVRRLRAMYDALKTEHPGMLVAAAKGEFGRAEWHYAPCCDLFGWYCAVPRGYGVSNVLPRTAAEHFNKAPEFIHVDYCRYGHRGKPWPEGEPHRDDLRGLGYPHTVTEVFEGMKQQWLEDYNNSYFHYFHPTRFFREKGAVTTTWSGEKLYVHPEGVNGPDVIAPRSTLGMSRAFAWCQRAAPVFLPTKVEKGNVAVLMTGRSFALGYSHGTSKAKWRDTAQALRRLQVSYGIVRDENLAELRQYGVLIAGLPA